MYVPSNVEDFFSKETNRTSLFQGDIMNSEILNLHEEGNEYSPNYWMVITKNCDLVINEDKNSTRKRSLTLIPLISFKLLNLILKRNFYSDCEGVNSRIVLVAVHNLFKVFRDHYKKTDLDNLIKNRISKFMFLPPDGEVLKEPMLIDFDIIHPLESNSSESVSNLLKAKILELVPCPENSTTTIGNFKYWYFIHITL